MSQMNERTPAPQPPPVRKPKRSRDIYAEIHNHDGNGGGCVPGKCACPCGCEAQLGCTAYGVMCSQCQLDESREGECRNIAAKREQAEAERKQAQIDRIAALESELAETRERLAKAAEALSRFQGAKLKEKARGLAENTHTPIDNTQDLALCFYAAMNVVVSRLQDALAATADAVAQHTADVERRGALKAARRILESFAELVEQHQFEVKDKEDLCYLVLHTATIKMLLWEWSRKVEDGAAEIGGRHA